MAQACPELPGPRGTPRGPGDRGRARRDSTAAGASCSKKNGRNPPAGCAPRGVSNLRLCPRARSAHLRAPRVCAPGAPARFCLACSARVLPAARRALLTRRTSCVQTRFLCPISCSLLGFSVPNHRGGSSIFRVEGRRSKIGGSSIFGSEDRRWEGVFRCFSIFGPEEWVEDRKEDAGGCDFFEDKGSSSKMGGVLRSSASEERRTSIFDLWGRKNKEPAPPRAAAL